MMYSLNPTLLNQTNKDNITISSLRWRRICWTQKKIATQEIILKVALLNLSIKWKRRKKIKNLRGKIKYRYNYLIKNKSFKINTMKISQSKKLNLNRSIFPILIFWRKRIKMIKKIWAWEIQYKCISPF